MRKHEVNLNDAITLIFELLYKTIIKLIEDKTIMREIIINSNQIAQRIANSNISELINIISKKQELIKQKVTLKIAFASLVLLIIAINNAKINKTLNILIRIFKDLKINNVYNITKSEIY